MIYTLRNVRVLDFQRVKDKERTENLTSTDSAAKQLPNTEDPALKMLSNTGGQAMEVSINDEKQIGGSATVVSAAAQMDEYEDMVC
uniref:Uncharacterized protein n=1 Tax=Ditylenchus dipsaci TaxID=166011 RepID=A0A915E8X0_9BILA